MALQLTLLAEAIQRLASGPELCARLREVLGPLVAYDARTSSDLVATLRTYVENGSVAETAERMFLHRNSVGYRLQRIQEIAAIDPRDRTTRLSLLVAFALTDSTLLTPSPKETNDEK